MPNAPGRTGELDGLRGIAALMVALSHFVLAFQPALLGGGPRVAHFPAAIAISHTAAIALFNPELGVAIFFVLSGFVLAASASRTAMPLYAQFLRRWVRLALPVLGTSLLIWPLAEWHLFRSVEAAGLAKSDWLAGNYAWLSFETNDLGRLIWQSLVDLYLRSAHFYNTALWTMPTEWRGSMILLACAALQRRLSRKEVWRAPWLGLAMSMIAAAFVWRSGFFGFPCGVALFELRRLLPPIPRLRAPAGFALLASGIFLGGMPFLIDLPFDGPYARLFLALAPFIDNPVLLMHRVAAVCLVAAALLCPMLRRALTGRVCQWLGRVSFMLYLAHVPIICSLCAWLLLRLAPVLGYDAATGLILPAFLATSLGVAAMCTRLIDEPTLRLIHAARLAAGARSEAGACGAAVSDESTRSTA